MRRMPSSHWRATPRPSASAGPMHTPCPTAEPSLTHILKSFLVELDRLLRPHPRRVLGWHHPDDEGGPACEAFGLNYEIPIYGPTLNLAMYLNVALAVRNRSFAEIIC
jgi:hypothetical protein